MGTLDLTSDPPPRRSPGEDDSAATKEGAEETPSTPRQKRKFLGIKFNCCGVYAHIYANKSGTAYEGRCPRCGKPIRLKIGPGGSDCRFFETT